MPLKTGISKEAVYECLKSEFYKGFKKSCHSYINRYLM